MIIRSWIRCASWFLLTTGLVVVLVSSESRNYLFALGLIAIFGLQGFVAEMLGLRSDETGFSFPRRIFRALGFPVLWRRKIPAKSVSRIDSFDSRTVRFYLTSCELVDVVLSDNDEKRRFLQFATGVLKGNHIRSSEGKTGTCAAFEITKDRTHKAFSRKTRQ
jgi:hypothetical protein